MILIAKQKQRCREQMYGHQGGKVHRGGVAWTGRVSLCVKQNEWEPSVKLREASSMRCGELSGKEIPERDVLLQLIHVHKDLHVNVHGGFTCNSWKVETSG